MAVQDSNTARIKTLIEGGADPNKGDEYGTTPLHVAVQDSGSVTIKTLVEGGADPLRTNKLGKSPLELARRSSAKRHIVNLLMETKSLVNKNKKLY